MSVPRSGRRQSPADRCDSASDDDSWAEFAMNALQEASMAHRQRRARRMSDLPFIRSWTWTLNCSNGFGALAVWELQVLGERAQGQSIGTKLAKEGVCRRFAQTALTRSPGPRRYAVPA